MSLYQYGCYNPRFDYIPHSAKCEHCPRNNLCQKESKAVTTRDMEAISLNRKKKNSKSKIKVKRKR